MVAALFAAGLVLGLLTRIHPFYDQTQSAMTPTSVIDSNRLYCVKRATVPWYVRSGQWHADMRSIAAIWRYLMDADLDGPTNGTPLAPAPSGNPA
ncbi:MAG TPA: hypothetical protein VKY92_26565 [Verrucomicrobiae bacterium]|jgi:hypothetical protein|nr:hypothetical protein [Verrucomicrobiae bacterium]